MNDTAVPGSMSWWERRWFLAAAILLSTVPLLYPPIAPLVDLPGHIGRFHVELNLANSPWLQRYYEFHWSLTGNLGVDLLIIPFAKLFGVELGTRIIILAIPPLTVAGFLLVAREVHGRVPPTALFAIPFAYGQPLLYGFVNYALSMALAFLGLALWLRLARTGRFRLRALLFVPISFVVFVCHTFGWGTLGLMCLSAEVVRLHDGGRNWLRSVVQGGINLLCMAGPFLLLLFWRHGAAGGTTDNWFNWQAKLLWLETALRDRWSYYDWLGVMATTAVLIGSILNDRLSFSRNLAVSALAMVVLFTLLPTIVFGSAFADMRVVPYMIATALLAIRFCGAVDVRLARWIALAGLLFTVVRLATNTVSFALASDALQRELAMVDRLPMGARVLFLAGQPCGDLWELPRKSQLGSMLIVRRDALVNNQWKVPGAPLLSVRNHDRLGWFAYDPSEHVRPNDCGTWEHWAINRSLAQFPRDRFDYVWITDAPPFDPRLVAGWQLLGRNGTSLLFKIRPDVAPIVQGSTRT